MLSLAPSFWQKLLLFFPWAMVLQSELEVFASFGMEWKLLTMSDHLGLGTGNQSFCDNNNNIAKHIFNCINWNKDSEEKLLQGDGWCSFKFGLWSSSHSQRLLHTLEISRGLERDFEMAIAEYVMQTKTLIWRKKNRWRSWGLCGTDAGSPSEHLVLGSSPPLSGRSLSLNSWGRDTNGNFGLCSNFPTVLL